MAVPSVLNAICAHYIVMLGKQFIVNDVNIIIQACNFVVYVLLCCICYCRIIVGNSSM